MTSECLSRGESSLQTFPAFLAFSRPTNASGGFRKKHLVCKETQKPVALSSESATVSRPFHGLSRVFKPFLLTRKPFVEGGFRVRMGNRFASLYLKREWLSILERLVFYYQLMVHVPKYPLSQIHP